MSFTYLMFDDNQIDIYITEFIGSAMGFSVYSSTVLTNYREDIYKYSPDILSIDLSRRQSFDFIRQVRKEFPKIPFMVVSGSISPNDISESFLSGACRFINKPLSEEYFMVLKDIIIRNRNSENLLTKNVEIGLSVVDNKIRIVELVKDDFFNLTDKNKNSYSIFYPRTGDNKRLKDAIEEFEYLINKPNCKEFDLHYFFKQYPDFILNDDYKTAHSKIVLELDDKKLIPDFILEPYGKNGLSDLLEIKLPSAEIVSLKKNRNRYSAAVYEACAQLREYAFFFDDHMNRSIFNKKYNIQMYKPKLFVIIGRRIEIDPFDFRRIQTDLPELHLKTYDHVLERMKRYL